MTFKRAIVRLSDVLDRIMRLATIGFLMALVSVVILQVIARYVFASPPAWTEEIARYAMIWAGLLGATMSFKRGFDPALFGDFRSRNRFVLFAAKLGRSLPVLIYLLPILLFCFIGANMTVERSFLVRHSRSMADAFDFPTLLVAIAVPIMIMTILVHLAAQWCGDKPRNGTVESLEVG
ncbi:TRAP transporter small permease subunit [Pelagibius sp. 7325]|uniref:TRAP transporter small permease n=1 Tax=Pelagibius sp. 7325 TaxID=3131994 RepID=UPI0030EB489C